VREELTAGEFEALTGLTPKALRLYAERGILSPVSVDPINGYRIYERAQGQLGITLDLLRRARVPMADLPTAQNFDFTVRRETVAMQRVLEDFYLDVAERIATFDPRDFVAQCIEAPAVDWVGVLVELGFPDDIDERITAVQELAIDTPAVDRELAEALSELGEVMPDTVWTAAPDDSRNGGRAMVIARPTHRRFDAKTCSRIAAQIRATTGQDVAVLTGTLPHRLEVTFTNAMPAEPTPVDEAAAGYLHVLAFEHHLAEHQLTAISANARQVVRGPSLFDGSAPTSVFDVKLP
jgi:DNA-binding transcriptional MerR regulator